jgi:hypothetical protein
MKKEKKTLEEWKNWVAKNSTNSYSLVTCLTILILIEARVKTEEEAEKVLQQEELGLSGFQALSAINWALKYEVEGLPDKDMSEIKIANPKK